MFPLYKGISGVTAHYNYTAFCAPAVSRERKSLLTVQPNLYYVKTTGKENNKPLPKRGIIFRGFGN